MNTAEIVRRIHRERQEWRIAGGGPEVSWTLRGLERAMEIVHELAREERKLNIARRPRLSRWMASDLYLAIVRALDFLRRGDRGRAIRKLEDAVELVKEARRDLQLPRRDGLRSDRPKLPEV